MNNDLHSTQDANPKNSQLPEKPNTVGRQGPPANQKRASFLVNIFHWLVNIFHWPFRGTKRYKMLKWSCVLSIAALVVFACLILYSVDKTPSAWNQFWLLAFGLTSSLLASFIVLLMWERQHEGPNEREAAFRRLFGISDYGPTKVLLVFCTRKLEDNADDYLRSYLEKRYVKVTPLEAGELPTMDVPERFADFRATLRQLSEISKQAPSLQHRHGVKDWLAKDDIWAARPLVAELEKLAGGNVVIELQTDEGFYDRLKSDDWKLYSNVISFGLGFNWATIFLAQGMFQIKYEKVSKEGSPVIRNAICLHKQEVSVLLDPTQANQELEIMANLPGYAVISRLHLDGKVAFIIAGRDADGTEAARPIPGEFVVRVLHRARSSL